MHASATGGWETITAPDFELFDREAHAGAAPGWPASAGRAKQRSTLESGRVTMSGYTMALGSGHGVSTLDVQFDVSEPIPFTLDGLGEASSYPDMSSTIRLSSESQAIVDWVATDTVWTVQRSGTLEPGRYTIYASFTAGNAVGGATNSYGMTLAIPEPTVPIVGAACLIALARRPRRQRRRLPTWAHPSQLKIGAAVLLVATTQALAVSPIVTGTDSYAGTGPAAHVKVFDGMTLAEQASFLPYGSFTGGVRVAVSDVTGDGRADVITGAGPGGSPHVKVFDGNTLGEVHSFFAYDGAFTGGVFVAAGDVTGDGRADVITGAGTGSYPVKVFNGNTQALERSFEPFPGSMLGVHVAAGDVNGDGRADIVAATGTGGGQLKVFDGVTGAQLADFQAFGPWFNGGLFVAAGDLTGDGRADLIAATAADGNVVRVFDGVTLDMIWAFTPFEGQMSGGVRVAAGDVTGDGFADIITTTGPTYLSFPGGREVRVFDGRMKWQISGFSPYGILEGRGSFVAGETPVPEPALAACAMSLAGFVATHRARRR